jgi:DNA mismatch repair protein MutS2
MAQAPDLLHEHPLQREDRELLRELVVFAFETGDASAYERAVDGSPPTPTRWEPDHFARDVFLPELCASCFPVRACGQHFEPRRTWLAKVLGRPPMEHSDLELRQAVLRELVGQDELRQQFEGLYEKLQRLRELLEQTGFGPSTNVRRKLDILAAFQEVVDAMASGFEGASSALQRIRQFGERVRSLQAYGRLRELLDYDEHLATLDVRLRLGYDGHIRGMELLAVRENTANSLVPSPVRRFFRKLWRLLRGYRFSEDEVLMRFVDNVFFALRNELIACLELVGQVEPYLAALGFRRQAQAHGLEVCLPWVREPSVAAGSQGGLTGVFNPLLLLQGVTPKPCDLRTGRDDPLVVLTGPNSGGKTRLLQAVAMVQMLGQAGFFVPAAKAELVRAPTMFVSLVDEVAAGQREGRLGTELLRIRRVFEQLDVGSMVVLDELCSGTNPAEGQVIFEMVVSLLPRLAPQVFISTHFLDLARELEQQPPVSNLEFFQVELDSAQNPTFRFVPGVASTSLAQQVAERLGVTRHELEALIELRLGEGQLPEAGAASPGESPSGAALQPPGGRRADDGSAQTG